ncbi:GNAT family N-acetyltransferase [Sphingomonas sp. BGYR3]|uniref:GNAT family N-acetyltransferase n=1 Tax=Sphingomonas sp. BGYR3 TaxID=2975483 RepID=UPI0021A2A3B1|nr:GNAT family N-acetyltransferase [Sphingomonas sp. BGYR3]MDG5489364.1 GNAT family N-acetyltransferase [Sphingomonas sp. BGYR3]
MNQPMRPADFQPIGPTHDVRVEPGVSAALDAVAAAAPHSHRFLRRAWFQAALDAYGGTALTLVVGEAGRPVLAMPLVPVGNPMAARAGMMQVPGCYWPFRSVPVDTACDVAGAASALLNAARAEARAIRLGPVYDGDPALEALRQGAAASGWAAISRPVATSFVLDIAARQTEGAWPRTSTLKKNRFHEKHLGAHGALEWSFVSGGDWTAARFDALAEVERASWIASRTDGSDAKFTEDGHGAFWRAAAADPVIAGMMWAAMLHIDGKPMAFSFDLNAGALKYAIANSYDPAVAKHSPGKLLYYRNLVRAIEDGITLVDWGAGDSGYKGVIGAEAGPAIRDWLFVRPGVSAAAARALAGLWRRSGNRDQ